MINKILHQIKNNKSTLSLSSINCIPYSDDFINYYLPSFCKTQKSKLFQLFNFLTCQRGQKLFVVVADLLLVDQVNGKNQRISMMQMEQVKSKNLKINVILQ